MKDCSYLIQSGEECVVSSWDLNLLPTWFLPFFGDSRSLQRRVMQVIPRPTCSFGGLGKQEPEEDTTIRWKQGDLSLRGRWHAHLRIIMVGTAVSSTECGRNDCQVQPAVSAMDISSTLLMPPPPTPPKMFCLHAWNCVRRPSTRKKVVL